MNDLHKLLESRDMVLRMYNDEARRSDSNPLHVSRLYAHLKECEVHIMTCVKGKFKEWEAWEEKGKLKEAERLHEEESK